MTMHVDIYAKGVELNDTLRDYVTNRMTHVQKYTNQDSEMHAYVEIKKSSTHHKSAVDLYHASCRLVIDGHEYYAETSDGDMYAAIDALQEHVYREVRDQKGKRESMFRKGHRMIRKLFKKGS